METGKLNSVTAQEMRGQLSDLLNRAAYAGESTLVTRQGKAVAVLVPVDDWERYLELKNSTSPAPLEGLATSSDPAAQE